MEKYKETINKGMSILKDIDVRILQTRLDDYMINQNQFGLVDYYISLFNGYDNAELINLDKDSEGYEIDRAINSIIVEEIRPFLVNVHNMKDIYELSYEYDSLFQQEMVNYYKEIIQLSEV